MSDQTSILAALETLVEARLGAGIVVPEPQTLEDLKPPVAVLYALDYERIALDFKQDLITYPFALFVKQKSNEDVPATRNALYDDFELIRTDLKADVTLSGVVRDSRITGMLVTSAAEGAFVHGVLNIDAVVLR